MRNIIAKVTVEELQRGPAWRAYIRYPSNPCAEISLDEDYQPPLVYRMSGDAFIPHIDLDFRNEYVIIIIEGYGEVVKTFTLEYANPNYIDILHETVNQILGSCYNKLSNTKPHY